MKLGKTTEYFMILFIIFIALGGILLNFLPFSVKEELHKTQTRDGVTIYYDLYYEPVQAEKRPLIVIGHGIFVNKEFMSSFALELAQQRFVVASIDWRGHGLSSGTLDMSGDFSELELDLAAVISDVERFGIADMSNLGLLGYSMGGYPTFAYAAEHPEVKAWVGMATTVNGTFGNATNPSNVLLINGFNDEIFSLSSYLVEFLNLTNVPTVEELQENHLYGDFSNGTARKFHVPNNADHFSVPWDRRFVSWSTKWFCQVFYGSEPNLNIMVFDLRMALMIIGMVGLVGLVFAFSTILAQNFKEYREDERMAMLEAIFQRDKFKRTLNLAVLREISPWAALLLSSIIVPVTMFAFSIPVAYSLLVVIIITLLNVINYARRTIKMKKKAVNQLLKMKIFTDPKIWLFSLLISVIFLAGFYAIIGLNFIGVIPSSTKAPYLILFIPLLFTIFGLFNIFIRKIVRPKLEEKFKVKKTVASFLYEGLIEFILVLGWNLAIIFLIAWFSGYLALVMNIFLLIPIFLFTSYFGLFMEKITRTVLPGALLHSFLVGFMFVTLTPLFGVFGFPA